MADSKALFTQRFDAARTAWTRGDEPAAAEALRQAIVAARSDHSLRRELASALFHLGKLSRKLGQAGEAEAEPLLSEALAIGEELFGSQGAALAPVLHELSRLHLQQSQHARAEDDLGRLLAITRVKGEEHPDVAAALVDLAFVKRKLGDDASAEALYREALRIREKVLDPNHMITVGTLERLSETCAARGNFAEALALLHRALPAREAALGAGHERVRATRSRVAELESQMAIAADMAAAAWTTRDLVDTPSTRAPSPVNSRNLEFVTGRESGPAYSDVILADLAHSDVAPDDAAPGDWRSTVPPVQTDSSEPARKQRTVRYASAGVATAAIAIVGLLMLRPRVGSGRALASTEMSAAQHTTAAGALVVTAPATRTTSAGTRAAAMVAGTHTDSLRVASATPVPTGAVIQREAQTAPPELRAPRVKLHLDSINMPAAPSADAILRSAMERQRASDTARTQTRDEISRPTPPEVDHAHTAPKLVGRPPEPAFPDALLRSGAREGQVLVRFMVDEDGTVDVASMIVERSDHELFTAAVREVLPRFRFEPAHTLTPESKPVAAWVSVPFRFTTKKR
jgi:TonB family protein